MAIVRIDTTQIHDWPSFHQIFYEVMGFPDYYGDNMDAWIDCMSCIGDPDSGMTQITIEPGEMLFIELLETEGFQQRCPKQFESLIACIASINKHRFTSPRIALLLA